MWTIILLLSLEGYASYIAERHIFNSRSMDAPYIVKRKTSGDSSNIHNKVLQRYIVNSAKHYNENRDRIYITLFDDFVFRFNYLQKVKDRSGQYFIVPDNKTYQRIAFRDTKDIIVPQTRPYIENRIKENYLSISFPYAAAILIGNHNDTILIKPYTFETAVIITPKEFDIYGNITIIIWEKPHIQPSVFFINYVREDSYFSVFIIHISLIFLSVYLISYALYRLMIFQRRTTEEGITINTIDPDGLQTNIFTYKRSRCQYKQIEGINTIEIPMPEACDDNGNDKGTLNINAQCHKNTKVVYKNKCLQNPIEV